MVWKDWLAIAGGLTVVGLSQPACERNAAESGDYVVDKGESGAGAALQAGASGADSASDGGAGISGAGTGGAAATSAGGADAAGRNGEAGREPGSGGSSAGEGAGQGGDDGGAGVGGGGGSGAGSGAGGRGSAGGGNGGAGAGSGAGGRSGADGGNGGAGAGSGGGPEPGGAGGVGSDPCVDAPDTDEDDVTDPCDDDDDDDGYVDGDDLAPLDPHVPGGLVAPGTIVNDACVKEVLAELEALGMTMPIHRGQFPPSQDGYYVRSSGQGKILAANDGAVVGASTTGMEARVVSKSVARFDSAVVEFAGGNPIGSASGSNAHVRGRDQDFTHLGGSGGLVVLFSATRGESGSWIAGRYLSLLLPTSGMPHAECPLGAGRYRFSSAPLTAKVEPAELDYMCVDENAGYVPNEYWTRGDGAECECTSSYLVSCAGP